MKNPFLEELARLARVNPTTCAHEASPANNENVMRRMQAMVGILCGTLHHAITDMHNGEMTAQTAAHLQGYLTTWEAAKAGQAERQARIDARAAEEAAQDGNDNSR